MDNYDFYGLISIDETQWGTEIDPLGLMAYQNYRRKKAFAESADPHIPDSSSYYYDAVKEILLVKRGPFGQIRVKLPKKEYDIMKKGQGGDWIHFLRRKFSKQEIELDEDSKSQQDLEKSRDFKRVLTGLMSHDAYNKKWKLGNYRKEDVEQIDEVLTLQQRMKRKILMRRLAPRLARARKISMRRRAGNDILKTRARGAAKRAMVKKLLGGRSKADVSPAERARVEKILAKRKKGIDRLAVKFLPIVRQKQAARFAHKATPAAAHKPAAATDHKPTATTSTANK